MKLILTDAAHTTILMGIAGFAIALAVLFLFVAAGEIAGRVRSSMAWYRLHRLASRLNAEHKDRKCARQIDRHLRSCGFVEVVRGRWEKRG